ncbi:hypothetical protein AKJ08_1624 [Vulgatibacter incomptus]|uniref:Uncharacterized protein n=1 Tax=Vulgatibacter incomptus TaxID=1391653 RepID=A0A0K1PCL1_9BACT|nr:hypothetical protein AKJ08_1624 [Vulgatibacter incomptus]
MIVSFGADPARIVSGQKSVLSWQTDGAAEIAITDEDGRSVDLRGEPASAGSVQVAPKKTTRYDLKAKAGGIARLSSTKVIVDPSEATIDSFEAEPALIDRGGRSTLSWKTKDAESIRIVDGDGVDVPGAGRLNPEGSLEVTPQATTTYTLEARRGEAVAKAEATVQVLGPPVVSFFADDAVIDHQGSTLLHWTVSGSTQIEVKSGSSVFSRNEPSGSLSVSPQQRTSYELFAKGPGGETSRTLSVSVRPILVSFESAGLGGPYPVGATLPLKWEIKGAAQLLRVFVTNFDDFDEEILLNQRFSGLANVPVPPDGRFRLKAVQEDESVEMDVVVEVL